MFLAQVAAGPHLARDPSCLSTPPVDVIPRFCSEEVLSLAKAGVVYPWMGPLHGDNKMGINSDSTGQKSAQGAST